MALISSFGYSLGLLMILGRHWRTLGKRVCDPWRFPECASRLPPPPFFLSFSFPFSLCFFFSFSVESPSEDLWNVFRAFLEILRSFWAHACSSFASLSFVIPVCVCVCVFARPFWVTSRFFRLRHLCSLPPPSPFPCGQIIHTLLLFLLLPMPQKNLWRSKVRKINDQTSKTSGADSSPAPSPH